MGQTNKQLRQDIEKAISIISDSFQAINYWNNKDLCDRMIGFLDKHGIDITDRVWSSLTETEHKSKSTMDKHFEPVTARSLAEKIVDKAQQFSPWQTRASQKNAIESIIEPHIRKPSDDDKSVPARCEEAYNEAIRLLENWEDIDSHGEIKYLKAKTAELLNKPNPFHEADIVHEDETEPTRVPFSLELAAQGHKVVTRDGREAKVVAEGLMGVTPLCAVITNNDGSKTACLFTLKGKVVDFFENNEDLFILKEPETIEIRVFQGKNHELHFTTSKVIANEDYWTYIKTIKITI